MKDTEHSNTNTAPQQVVYSPSDIHFIIKENLQTTRNLLVVEGLYSQCGQKDYRGYWYDAIKAQFNPHRLTAIVPTALRCQLSDGELIQVSGVIEKSLNENGQITLQLRVSNLVGKKKKPVDEGELKAIELQQAKAAKGYQNVDSLLETVLYQGDRKPKVALVFAETSITDQDFKAGIQAAQQAIDFNFNGFTFTRIPEFIHKLELLDTSSFDLICLVRGGGSGISEVFDNTDLAEAIIRMKTPVLSAIGHQVDNPLVCKVADKNIGTPSLLGQYFKDMVERIVEEKNHSKAALVDQVKKQFADQINTLQKQLTEQSKGFLDQRAKDASEMEKLRNQVKNVVQVEKAKRKKLVVAVVVLSVILVSLGVLFVLLSNNK